MATHTSLLVRSNATLVERRTAESLSKREIIRCLKRYLGRELYQLLPPLAEAPSEANERSTRVKKAA